MFLESKDRAEFFFNDYLLEEFHVMNFGREQCLANHSFGPLVRDYFVLHYVIKGKGRYTSPKATFKLHPGCFFLITPEDQSAIYQADAADPWEYVWFGFEGNRVAEILQSMGYTSEIRVGEVLDPHAIEEILQPLTTGDYLSKSSTMAIQGTFLQILSNFTFDGRNLSLSSNANKQQRYLDQFLLFIRQNYGDSQLTVSDIADELNLNSSYLSRLVSKEFGQNCREYLMAYRMMKARFLIENSDHTIAMIARAVGYENPLSFSRAYKKVYGHSPRHEGRS